MARSLSQQVCHAVESWDVQVAFFPPFVFLSDVISVVGNDNHRVRVGAQNIALQDKGAFTGEISGIMVAGIGCSMVIVGHSERRALFNETSDMVACKVQKALESGLEPVLCVGETLQERKPGEMEKVLRSQLAPVLARLSEDELSRIIIAYEPVWAIGTGVTATPDQAQGAHAFLRGLVAESAPGAAESIKILYGGSVKADNAQALFSMADIDGALVGGASLIGEEFIEICRAAKVQG